MIQLKIPPWAASVWDAGAHDWIVTEREATEVPTVADLLTGFVLDHHDFDGVVFDRDTRKVGDYVLVFLNDDLLQEPDVATSKLKDGDKILLLPEIAGG
jgi:molybdopterin converting factor small subunit